MSAPLRIFLAEDNAADVFLVREALRACNLPFELLRVKDGEAAVQALTAAEASGSQPDLFLLDLNLPKTSGHELLARIHASDALRHIPVIVLTSSDSPEDRAMVASAGVTEYFRKPSEYDEFLRLGHLIESVCNTAPHG